MRMLEMFAQHADVSNFFRAKGWIADSIGIYGRATIKKDVMDIKIGELPYYDFIWSSPPCERFSKLSHLEKNRNPQKDQEAVELHKHQLRIIESIAPELVIIENPVGKLRHQEFMKSYYRYTINQGQYGLVHLKPTDLFSNNPSLVFKPKFSKGIYTPFAFSDKKFRSRYPSYMVEDIYNVTIKALL